MDASGRITGLNHLADTDSHAFNNLPELARILATEGFNSLSACAAEQFTRLAQG